MSQLDYWRPVEVNGKRYMVRRHKPEQLTSEQWSECLSLAIEWLKEGNNE